MQVISHVGNRDHTIYFQSQKNQQIVNKKSEVQNKQIFFLLSTPREESEVGRTLELQTRSRQSQDDDSLDAIERPLLVRRWQ